MFNFVDVKNQGYSLSNDRLETWVSFNNRPKIAENTPDRHNDKIFLDIQFTLERSV